MRRGLLPTGPVNAAPRESRQPAAPELLLNSFDAVFSICSCSAVEQCPKPGQPPCQSPPASSHDEPRNCRPPGRHVAVVAQQPGGVLQFTFGQEASPLFMRSRQEFVAPKGRSDLCRSSSISPEPPTARAGGRPGITSRIPPFAHHRRRSTGWSRRAGSVRGGSPAWPCFRG